MDILTRLFGQCGMLRFEFVTVTGETGTGKMYVESFNNDNEDFEDHVKNILLVEEGFYCAKVKILGFAEQ